MNLIFLMIDNYAITGVQANFERGHQDENGTFISESNLHINIEDKK